MKVSFTDLGAQYRELKKEIDEAIKDAVENSRFVGGKPVRDFEEALAKYCQWKFACGVASGTMALSITLRALGLKPDDEVITTVHTAIPTAEAITLAGGKVVFCDIEEDTFQIDPACIEAAITPRTKAIIPVHLYGLSARIETIMEIAEKHELAVVEDIAQAQGTRFNGKLLGTFGIAAGLSFFPSKNLGAFGDGGAVITEAEELYTFVRKYSNHGRLEKYVHEMEGANERLDSLQAAILKIKLTKLDEWLERKRRAAKWYQEALKDVEPVILPNPIAGCEPSWHLYVIRVPDRDDLMKSLKEKGISTGLHYPSPLNLQPAYAYMKKGAGSFPVAEKITGEILSLPMFPHIKREEVEYVATHIKAYYKG